MAKNTFYITTPIYYPSGKFHIGTAYSTILSDSIKRYKEMRGFDSYLLTGLDEHGQKIEKVALENNITPQKYVDNMAIEAKKLWSLLDISNDDFIRTTDIKHVHIVEQIFDQMMDNNDIYLGEYNGWYCVQCETFYSETQLVDGKCPDCGRTVEKTSEQSYFFNMKKYEKRLLEFYEANPDFLIPASRKNEIINNFIKPGLEDLCVSRTSFDWGIKVLKNPKHVVYVWLDALVNYISALGYKTDNDELFNKYWPADVHIVGKDIVRFHAIYWPIFLMALNLPLPKQIYAHGWYIMKDGKMSKSKGNTIYPDVLANKYGVDATRYLLLREISFDQDGLFSMEGFIDRFNNDLSNDLGNLVSRTIGMINKYYNGLLELYSGIQNDADQELETFVKETVSNVENYMDTLHVANALAEIFKIVSKTNKYIDVTEPWNLFKTNNQDKLKSVMYHLTENIREVAILLTPFMPTESQKILDKFNIKDELRVWDSLYKYDSLNNIEVVKTIEPLFMRLDKEEALKER